MDFSIFGSSACPFSLKKKKIFIGNCVSFREKQRKNVSSCWRPVNAPSDASSFVRKQVRFLCTRPCYMSALFDQSSMSGRILDFFVLCALPIGKYNSAKINLLLSESKRDFSQKCVCVPSMEILCRTIELVNRRILHFLSMG